MKSPALLVALATVAVMAATTPLIAHSALSVLGVETQTPMEWVQPSFGPRKEYERYTREFGSGDVVVVSWPGCELGRPELERVVEAATDAQACKDPQGKPWFDSVTTGSVVVDRLMSEPLSLDSKTAVERLEGLLVGPDGKTTCVVFGFTLEGLADRRRAVAWIRDIVRQTAMTDDAKVRMAGPVIDHIAVDIASKESLERFAPPAALAVLLLTWWSLKSFRYSFFVFLISMWCVGLSFATLHAWGDKMNAVLIVMPALVLVLGVSGGIHLVNYLVDSLAAAGGERRGVAARAVRLGWLPCLLSAGTTAIGLISLVVSELEPIRTFGFHAAIGVMATFVGSFLVLPGLFERWPIRPGTLAEGTAPHGLVRWRWFPEWVIRHATLVVMVFIAAMAVAGAGVPGIRTSVRIDTLFQPESRVIRDYAWIEKTIGPLVPIEVILKFSGASPPRPAERLLLVEKVGEKLEQTTGASSVMSAASFAPDASAATGFRKAAVRAVAARKLEQGLAVIDDMKYIRDDDDGQSWRTTARISALDEVDYGRLLRRVEEAVDPIVEEAGGAGRGITTTYTGVMPLIHAVQNTLLHDLFTSFLSACGLITLVMMFEQRGFFTGLVAMISNVFPMILLFGSLGWTGKRLDIGSVMTASIALGMAIDGTLHFLTFFRRALGRGASRPEAVHAAFDHCAAAMTQSSVVCGLGILVFALSTFAPTSRFAWMLCLLVAAALAGDLVLLPAMLVGPLGRLFKPL